MQHVRVMVAAPYSSSAVVAVRPSVCLLHVRRYLQGAAHNVQAERHDDDGDSKQPKPAAAGEAAVQLTPQALAVQLICRCDEIPDEGVEVLVLRGLLTASTSLAFTLHGQALLLAVRTCYNIHLMSRSEVNQTTAKAALTQMLNVVFQRMEAGSVKIAVSGRLPAGCQGDVVATTSRCQLVDLLLEGCMQLRPARQRAHTFVLAAAG
jgi:hypothetical protein